MLLNPTSAEVPGWAVYAHGLDFWIKAEGWNHSQIFPALRETPQCMPVEQHINFAVLQTMFFFKNYFFSCEILIVNGTSFWMMACGREWLVIILLDFIFFMLLWEKRKRKSTLSITSISQPIFCVDELGTITAIQKWPFLLYSKCTAYTEIQTVFMNLYKIKIACLYIQKFQISFKSSSTYLFFSRKLLYVKTISLFCLIYCNHYKITSLNKLLGKWEPRISFPQNFIFLSEAEGVAQAF